MKRKLIRFLPLLAVMLSMLLPSCAAAVTGKDLSALRGERSYPQALDLPDAATLQDGSGVMRLSASGEPVYPTPDPEKIAELTDYYRSRLTDLGAALDFLTVFSEDFVGSLVHRANSLQSLFLLTEKNFSPEDREQIARFLEDYSLIASNLYAEIEFLTTKLAYGYNRIDVLVAMVQSGECSPSEIDGYLSELAAVYEEANERLNSFTNDEEHLYQYLMDFYTAELMIQAMDAVISSVYDEAKDIIAKESDALAQMENAGKLRAAGTHVAVVSKSQYVVSVRDTGGNPVKDAQVEIRLLGGDGKLKKTLPAVTTDAHGYAFLWFADLGADSDGKAEINVVARADGYRTQTTGRITAQGGSYTALSLEPDNGEPYVIETAYNGEDMLHVQNGIYVTPYNHNKQSLSFTVNASVPCVVQLYQPNGEEEKIVAEFHLDPASPGSAVQDAKHPTEFTRTFQEEYASGKHFLPRKPVYVRIVWKKDGGFGSQETQTPFLIKKARVPNPAVIADGNKFIGSLGFTLPNDWPVFGGSQFKIPFPKNTEKYKFTAYLDLNGTFYFGAAAVISPKWANWKNQSMKNRAADDKELADANASRSQKMLYGLVDDYSQMGKEHFLGEASASLMPYFMVIARRTALDDDEDEPSEGWYEYQADLTVGLILTFKYSATGQWLLGPLPVFITFDFSIGFNFVADLGLKFDAYGLFADARNLKWSDSTGLTFSPFLEVAVTAGIGVSRFAYVGIRARAYASGTFILAPRQSFIKMSAVASIYADVQLFFYRKLFTIKEISWSWSATDQLQTRALLAALDEEAARQQQQARLAAAAADNPDSRTQLQTIVPLSFFEPREPLGSHMEFIPVSMRSFRNPKLPDAALALWIRKYSDGRSTLQYRSSSLDEADDLGSQSWRSFDLPGMPEGYALVDFSVDYYCKDENTAPVIYIAATAVPIGTPEDEVQFKSRLLLGRYTVTWQWLDDHWKDRRCIKLEGSADFASFFDHEGYIMPRVSVIEGSDGRYSLGALLAHRSGDGIRYSVETFSAYTMKYISDASFPVGWEPVDFALLSQSIMALNEPQPFFLLMRSTAQEDQTRFYLFPTSKSIDIIRPTYKGSYFGGGAVNLSHFQMIEEHDKLYNKRQVGIGALRLVRDEETGLLQNRLFLMSLDTQYTDVRNIWRNLNPVDTGIVVNASSLSFLEINGAHYAYWPISRVDEKRNLVYDVNACYVSCGQRVASKPFTLLENLYGSKRLPGNDQTRIDVLKLMPLAEGGSSLYGMLLSCHEERNGSSPSNVYLCGKFAYNLQLGLEVTALVPEYPVILPGDTFTSYVKVRNTGMMPLYSFTIDFLTRPEGKPGAKLAFVKQIYVDMAALDSAVRNVNPQSGEVTGSVRSGEAAVYRQDDGTKESNGEIMHLTYFATYDNTSQIDSIGETGREDRTLRALPADGELNLKTSFTAPLDCWGDATDVELLARVRNLEGGVDLVKTDASASFSGGREYAVTMSMPMTAALSNDEGDSFEKVTLSPACVSYAYLDENGSATDEAAFDLTGNDLKLEADVILSSGVPAVQITLRNLDGAQSADVTPMLVAMVDGKETWRYALRTELTSDYTRCLTLPLSTLAGGRPYSSIDLYLTSSTLRGDVLDFAAFGEVNDYDNHATLYPVYDFYFVKEPQSTTAFVGQDVTMTAEAAGGSGPFTYQWFEVNTDGTLRTLKGETGTSLTLKKVTLAQDSTKYRCIAANSQGIRRSSSTATLTVSEELPVTGDTSHAAAWLALLGISGMLLLLALRRASSVPRD